MHLGKKAAEEAHENNYEKECCINYCHKKKDKIHKQKPLKYTNKVKKQKYAFRRKSQFPLLYIQKMPFIKLIFSCMLDIVMFESP